MSPNSLKTIAAGLTSFLRIFLAGALLLLGVASVSAEPPLSKIFLNNKSHEFRKVNVTQSTEIQLNNNFNWALHNFTVTRIASGKPVLEIKDLESMQSVTLAFQREGAYSICYWLKPEGKLKRNLCMQINVLGLKPA